MINVRPAAPRGGVVSRATIYTILLGSVKTLPAQLLSGREAAAILGLHPGSLKRWRLHGRIKAVVLNSRVVRYEAAEIERIIREGRIG